jgi:hypothetical protein
MRNIPICLDFLSISCCLFASFSLQIQIYPRFNSISPVLAYHSHSNSSLSFYSLISFLVSPTNSCQPQKCLKKTETHSNNWASQRIPPIYQSAYFHFILSSRKSRDRSPFPLPSLFTVFSASRRAACSSLLPLFYVLARASS